MKKFISAAAISLVVTACAAAPEMTAKPATAENVQAAIEAAEASRKQAASVGYEWRDTGKYIETAQELAKAGKLDEAMTMATKAEHEGQLGYAQWQTEKSKEQPIP